MIFEHAQYFDTLFCFYMKNDLIELSFPLEQPIYMHWNVWVWNAFISLVSFYSHFPPLIPQTCTPWSLKSPPTRLFIQKFLQASIKINIQVPHYCFFCGGIHWWRPVDSTHRGPWCGNHLYSIIGTYCPCIEWRSAPGSWESTRGCGHVVDVNI